MKVTGVREFSASRGTVWEVLNDPSRMAKTMPGVEGFEVQDDTHWSARVKIPLGLGGLKMSINFEKTEERPPDYAKLVAKGQGVGALMQMTTQFELDEAGSGTSMRWEADVRIAGAVGAMGQRVLQPIVNQQVQQVLSALEKQIDEAAAAGPAPGAETPPQEASSGGGSAGAPPPSADAEPHTDPELKDDGPPADVDPDADPPDGSSGAEEGLNPWAPESYDPDAEGPTTSTEDR
jgi:carbon monoxide dehydrogenase subunit G